MALDGRTVLTRVDINVPMEAGRVTDTTRLDRIKPTIDAILKKGGKPLLIAHFGRPKGRVVDEMSLRRVVPALATALGRRVQFIETLEGAENPTAEAKAADVLLLENIRFHPGEEANEAAFAARLAALGDVYCNDAFSTAHRAHASTEALARNLPACAGRLMQAELSALEAALGAPDRPLLAVVGGAKVSTKLDLLGHLVEKVNLLVIGGGMANTFLAAQGLTVGTSLCEHDMAGTARAIMGKAGAAGCDILLPADVVVAEALREGVQSQIVPAHACPEGQMILDAGPHSVARITAAIDRAKTLIWNGPLGAFETVPFDYATNAAARHTAARTQAGQLVSVAGGGDTVAALNHAGAGDGFTYVSTAGGAFLEWMEGKTLPGVAALER